MIRHGNVAAVAGSVREIAPTPVTVFAHDLDGEPCVEGGFEPYVCEHGYAAHEVDA